MSGHPPAPAAVTTHTHYRRFDQADRILHVCLMFSFLGLAFTGLPLLFSHEEWAAHLARLFGGFQSAGTIHRFCAIVMIGVFVTHLARLVRRLFVEKVREDQKPVVVEPAPAPQAA